MSRTDAIRAVEAAIRQEAREALPGLIGELERLKAEAQARLFAGESDDALLTADEAAEVLRLSPATLYRNADRYPFARREGRLVRFSRRGVQEYVRRQG